MKISDNAEKLEIKNNDLSKKILHILGMISLSLCMVVLAFTVILQINYGKNQFMSEWVMELNKGWEVQNEDGSFSPTLFPVNVEQEDGKPLTIRNTLPEELGPGAIFTMYTSTETYVYIDGEERFHFSEAENDIPGGIVASAPIQVELDREDAGKTITIEKCGKDGNNGYVQFAYIGNSYGTYKSFVNSFGTKFAVALILFAISFFIFLAGWIMLKVYKVGKEIVLLSSAVICISIWSIMDNSLYPFLFERNFVSGTLGYMITLVMPLPLMFYMNRIQKGRYALAYIPMSIITIVSSLVFSALHFWGIRDFRSNLLIIDIMVLLPAFVVVGTIIVDVVKKQAKEISAIYIGFAILGACGVIEVMLINNPRKMSVSLDGVFLLLGIFSLLITTVVNTIQSITKTRVNAARLAKESELKSTFLANMSHEIRTPVGAIMGMNELILREDVSDSVREYADNIKSASENLLEVINDILDFSKIEAGKMEIVPQNYELAKMLNDVINMIKVKTANKGLQFKVSVDEFLPTTVFGDETRIRQIMINILNNAVKYTPAGEVGLNVSGVNKMGEFCLKIKVSDTGIGIKEEDRVKLFDKFVRLDEKTNSMVEGSGLGLSIVESYVSLMGGEISVESVYGEGSTFIIILPQKIVNEKPIGNIVAHIRQQKTKEKYEPSFVAKSAKVLVVDDNYMNLRVISGLLKKTEVVAETCQSGEAALARIKEEKFDVIFLDHMMPEMDGIETLVRMKSMKDNLNKETPVIALTANAIKGAREEYLEAGFNDYMSKPISPQALEDMLIEYLPEEKMEER